MVVINDNGVNITFPSEYSEITIGQLDKLSEIFELDITETEQWILIISYLAKIKREVVEEWPVEDFYAICSQLFINLPDNSKQVSTITMDGYTYTAPERNSLTARESAMVEKVFSKSQKNRFAQILAIIFKRDDLSSKEHFADAHIKYKAKLLADHPAEPLIGVLSKFGIQFLENINEMINEDTQTAGDIES